MRLGAPAPTAYADRHPVHSHQPANAGVSLNVRACSGFLWS